MVSPLRAVRNPRTESELLDDWQLWMQARGLARRTVREYGQTVARVAEVANFSPEGLSTRQIQTYLAHADVSQSTRATYHVALTSWFRWLVDQEHRDDNPMTKIPRPKIPRRRARPVETAHLERLLASRMHARTRTMILLAAFQGLRVHEIAKIRGEDVDLLGARLYVKGKGGVDEWLPLHPLIAAEAVGYPRRGWWFVCWKDNRYAKAGKGPVLARSVSTVIGNAMARAGVPGSAHSLRHWYGTQLSNSGADATVVQTLMRHASLATTQIYVQVADVRRVEAIGRLPVLEGA